MVLPKLRLLLQNLYLTNKFYLIKRILSLKTPSSPLTVILAPYFFKIYFIDFMPNPCPTLFCLVVGGSSPLKSVVPIKLFSKLMRTPPALRCTFIEIYLSPGGHFSAASTALESALWNMPYMSPPAKTKATPRRPCSNTLSPCACTLWRIP